MKLRMNRDAPKVAVYAVLFFVFLSLNYTLYISDIYAYSGFYLDFSAGKYALSLLIIIFAFLLVRLDTGFRNAIKSVMLGVVVIPALVYFSCGPGGWFFLFSTLLCVSIVSLASAIKVPSLVFFSISSGFFEKALLGVMALYLVSVAVLGGGHFNLSLMDVYEFRGAASSQLPGVFGYFSPIVGKILVPLFVVLSASRKNWAGVSLGFLIGLLIFGFTAHKAPFFYPMVTLAVYWMSKHFFARFFILALASVSVITLVDFFIADLSGAGGTLGSLFARRALLVPAHLNFLHLDFFSSNPHALWANSKISFGLVADHYQLSTPNVIGMEYYGSPEMAANTGWIGSGYANGGLLGMAIYSFSIGLLIAYIAEQGKRIGQGVVLSISFVTFFTIFRSSDLVTSLMTHGVLFLVLLLGVIPPLNDSGADSKDTVKNG